jgi:hypothetical protein
MAKAPIDRCRYSAGKPTAAACLRAGGDQKACRDQAIMAVKRCLSQDGGTIQRCKELALQRGFDRGHSRVEFIRSCVRGGQK